MTLLEVKDLSLNIGPFPIFRDIDLSVEKGEILGIIGESGSGKSMTALSIMQLLPGGSVNGGSIRLDGVEIVGRSEAEMVAMRGRDIGMVFQEPMTALNPVKTIGDQVAETVLVHGRAGREEAMR
ncbi:MAG TPA: ATP-binding cassette domain-containing protein, partial [Devosia sp.]|nr:ATP-binding cassette domain-containing protein [Devosia sp.]